jgi:hypothetical protein
MRTLHSGIHIRGIVSWTFYPALPSPRIYSYVNARSNTPLERLTDYFERLARLRFHPFAMDE